MTVKELKGLIQEIIKKSLELKDKHIKDKDVQPFEFLRARKTRKSLLNERFGVFIWGAVVEEVRTIFERLDDVTVYIPSFEEMFV